jgi:DNA-binding NtrC family response regulator
MVTTPPSAIELDRRFFIGENDGRRTAWFPLTSLPMISLMKRKARLLVLDDDPSIQRLVSMILRREGYRVDVVSEASKAIELLKSGSDYGALLLDIMTPTEGGMTVIKHLRTANAAMLKRVILVTGSPDSVLKTVAKDVFAIVRKPFETKELKETVARAIVRT